MFCHCSLTPNCSNSPLSRFNPSSSAIYHSTLTLDYIWFLSIAFIEYITFDQSKRNCWSNETQNVNKKVYAPWARQIDDYRLRMQKMRFATNNQRNHLLIDLISPARRRMRCVCRRRCRHATNSNSTTDES